MNSFHILCIFLFDFSLSLLIRSLAGGLQRVFIVPLLSQSHRSTPIGPVLLMTYLCQWLFLIPALHGRTHTPLISLPSRVCRKRQAVSEESNATDSCCSPSQPCEKNCCLFRVYRLGSAHCAALSAGSASCFCCGAGQAARRPGPQVIDKQIMETNKACLLSLRMLVFRVAESTAGVGQLAPPPSTPQTTRASTSQGNYAGEVHIA